MKLLVVFCVYSLDRLNSRNVRFRALFELIFSIKNVHVVVVNNNSSLEMETLFNFFRDFPSVNIIKGTNEFAEFSAWTDGIACASENEYDYYLMLNDTVFSHFYFNIVKYIRSLGLITLNDSRKPAVVGTLIDLKTNRALFSGIEYNKFVCTAFFIFNNSAKTIFIDSCNICFERWIIADSHMNNKKDLLSCFFDDVGADYIGRWLFDGGWYNSKDFEQFDKKLLKLKLNAILCEHYFSANVSQSDGMLIDIDSKYTLNPRLIFNVVSHFGLYHMLKTFKAYVLFKWLWLQMFLKKF